VPQKAASALILLLLLLSAVGIYYGIENSVDKRVAAEAAKGPTIEALWRLDLFAFVLALAGVALHEIVALYRAMKSSSSHISGWPVFLQSLVPLGVLAVTVLLVVGLRALLPPTL
jgi:hypothetical protein